MTAKAAEGLGLAGDVELVRWMLRVEYYYSLMKNVIHKS